MDVSIVSSSSVMVVGVDPSSSVIVDRGLAANAVTILADALVFAVLMVLLMVLLLLLLLIELRFLKFEELLIIRRGVLLLCCIVKA